MKRNAKNGTPPAATRVRCVVYTRKSTEEGLEQEFNSLDAQRDAGENYIKSLVGEGWTCLPDRYDDGGDALEHGGAYADDAQVVHLEITKREPVEGGKTIVRIRKA